MPSTKSKQVDTVASKTASKSPSGGKVAKKPRAGPIKAIENATAAVAKRASPKGKTVANQTAPTAASKKPTQPKSATTKDDGDEEKPQQHKLPEGGSAGQNIMVFYRGGEKTHGLKEISHDMVIKKPSLKKSKDAKRLLKVLMVVFSTQIFDNCKLICNTSGRTKIGLRDVVTYVNTSYPPDDQVVLLNKIKDSIDSYRNYQTEARLKGKETGKKPLTKSLERANEMRVALAEAKAIIAKAKAANKHPPAPSRGAKNSEGEGRRGGGGGGGGGGKKVGGSTKK